MTAKERKWLEHIDLASKARGGMYRGETVDIIPPRHLRNFEARGWVEIRSPHNPVHKDRAVITEAGREAIAAMNN